MVQVFCGSKLNGKSMKYEEDDLFDLERKGIIINLPCQELDKILKTIVSPEKYRNLKKFIKNDRFEILEQLTEQEELKFDINIISSSIEWYAE